MDNIVILKIFESGIYGTKIETFTNEELWSVILNPIIEILSESEHINIKKNYTTNSFYDSTKAVLQSMQINNDNRSQPINKLLKNYYIKMNAIEWRNKVIGNVFLFKRIDYYFILDKLVRNDFVKYNEINNDSKITNNILIKFFDKMVSIGYFEMKNENNEIFYRIIRKNGRIEAPNIQKKIPELFDVDRNAIEKRLKTIIKNRVNGITNTEIAAELKITTKLSLKFSQSLCNKNKEYQSLLELEGKIKRFRFIHVKHIEKYKNSEIQKLKPASILRENKLSILKAFIEERKPFIADLRVIKEFAQKMNSKYVPDSKNFKKLVIESGYKIIPVNYFENNIVKHIVCDKTTDEKTVTERFKPKFIKRMSDTNSDIIYQNFVTYRKFIEIDNGFIDDMNKRIVVFVKYLEQNSNSNKELFFDKDFLLNMKLKDTFKFLAYPFYLKERKEIICDKESFYLYESNDPRSEGTDISHDNSYNDLVKKNYNNMEFLKLRYLLLLINLKQIFDKLIEDGYKCKKNATSYEIDLRYQPEFQKIKYIPFKHISLDRRLDFYQRIHSLDKKNIIEKIRSIIDGFYIDDENVTLSQRLFILKRKLKNDKQFFVQNYIPHYPQKLTELYILLKKQLMNENLIILSNYENSKSMDFKKAIELLKSNKLIILNDDNEKYLFNKEYMNSFDVLKIQTIFPLEYFWINIKEDNDVYLSKHAKLIAYHLILCGTTSISNLLKKIKILEEFELRYLLEVYNKNFTIQYEDCTKYVSLLNI